MDQKLKEKMRTSLSASKTGLGSWQGYVAARSPPPYPMGQPAAIPHPAVFLAALVKPPPPQEALGKAAPSRGGLVLVVVCCCLLIDLDGSVSRAFDSHC